MQLTIVVYHNDSIRLDTLVSYIKSFYTDCTMEVLDDLDRKELLNKLEKNRIDAVFLDIEGMGGIELGRKIREKCEDCIITFIAELKDYAFEAFEIKAFDYILKPITKKRFEKCIENIILRIKEKRILEEINNVFTIKNKDNTIKIKYEDIFYFEKLKNKIRVYTSKEKYEYYGTLKELKKELDMNKNFIQCHQGYIVNRLKILELRGVGIYIGDIKKLVPVSRRYKANVRKALEDSLFC